MPPRDSQERTQDAGGAFAEFAGRWRVEIRQLARELREWFVSDEVTLPTILFADDAIVVRPRPGAAETRIARDSALPSAQISEALTRLIGSQAAPKDIALAFPESRLLRMRVALPNGRSQVLRKALGYEIERLSPIDANEVYFDFDKTAPGAAAGLREIDVRVIRREVVDSAVAICIAANLRVGAIGFGDDARPADWRALPVDRMAFARQLWRRWSAAILAGTAVFLGMILIFAAYARGAAEQEAALAAVAQEREQAAIVEHLQQRTRTAISASEFVSRQKSAPMLVSTLAEISRILPDNTWITQMSISDGKLRLQGYSRASSDLIVLFDKSPHFANAQFVAPLTRDDTTKVERFDLSLDIRPAPR